MTESKSGPFAFICDPPPVTEAKIKVIGIGDGGSSAVNRMIEADVQSAEFIVVNTDVEALNNSKAPIKIQIGKNLTQGSGASSDPNIGRDAALEDREKILAELKGANMVFVLVGLGGGTGTGAAPVIASLAKEELDALTVAIVTEPFSVEEKTCLANAEKGLAKLRGCVDTIITIPISKLKEDGETISTAEVFRRFDDTLLQFVRDISDLINLPDVINVDVADVKEVMRDMGTALVGTGRAKSENAPVKAMKAAINSKFFEGISIKGAKGVLINITGSKDMPLDEIEEAISLSHEAAHDDANIIFGTVFKEEMDNEVQVTLIATGFDNYE